MKIIIAKKKLIIGFFLQMFSNCSQHQKRTRAILPTILIKYHKIIIISIKNY